MMTKQKKKNPEKSGLVHNVDQRGADRKGHVRDLEKVTSKQRDSPKIQRKRTGSIKGRAELGRRCYQENRERLQSRSSQRTEATRKSKSNGKYSQGEFHEIRASDQPQRTVKRSEQRGPQGRVTIGDTGLKNESRWIQGKAHRIVATPDKSPDIREKQGANANKGKMLGLGEADKQPNQDVRDERDRVVAHPPPSRKTLLHFAILPHTVEARMRKHRKDL